MTIHGSTLFNHYSTLWLSSESDNIVDIYCLVIDVQQRKEISSLSNVGGVWILSSIGNINSGLTGGQGYRNSQFEPNYNKTLKSRKIFSDYNFIIKYLVLLKMRFEKQENKLFVF